jgi:hypothetical protein
MRATSLLKLLNVWKYPVNEEFRGRKHGRSENLLTYFVKSRSPQRQIDGTLRITNVFRRELAL